MHVPKLIISQQSFKFHYKALKPPLELITMKNMEDSMPNNLLLKSFAAVLTVAIEL